LTPATGQSLLHYRLVEKIGEGGMGVVWRARDTRLNRDVAVKLLPEEVSGDTARLARFQREARTLASLQHPNVATIFGIEQDGAQRFLVMEMVEGEDLAQRLKRGAVPVEDALAIARQLAEGLEAAHEKGIVHRDLKPANVKLTPDGRVKVLDFGLAKAFADESMEAAGDASLSPTITAAATRAGVIVGTAAYMSPEQARCRPVDRRADIWAFGCVLYEMLTGERPFGGGTVSDTLAAVLKSEPDLSRLPADTTTRIRALVVRCLRKDPTLRLRDIGDARLELAEALSDTPDVLMLPGGTPHRIRGWLWAAVGLLAGVIATAAGLRFFVPVAAPELRKLSISIPDLGVGWFASARISPDGRRIAYKSGGRLWIRDLQSFDATEIPGTEGARTMFWSPGSTKLGFARDGKLWSWTVAGGQIAPICQIAASGISNGGVWGKDEKIYFATFRGGLYQVASAGGDPRLLLPLEPSEVDFHEPELLPDGEHLIMTTHSKNGPHQVIVVSVQDGARKTLGSFEGIGTVTYSQTGHLLLNFVSGRERILAAPFSVSKLDFAGDSFLVASGGQFPSVSANGTLIYSLGSSSVLNELVWVDADGRIGQVAGRPRLGLDTPALSPDGRKVAVVAYENDSANIWIQDLTRGTWSRLVSGPQDEHAPVWSKSGNRIFYLRLERDLFYSVMEVEVGGSEAPRIRAEGVEDPPLSVSPDDRSMVYVMEKEARRSLWSLDLSEESAPVRLTPDASISEWHPAISPDGRWLAYVSNETGTEEVFIRAYPDGTRKQQVSLNGGSSPSWSRGGDALLYWEDGALIEVTGRPGVSLTTGTARTLFNASAAGLRPTLDVAADGRFLAVRRSSEDPHQGLLLVENWIEEFSRR
jgi:serine/threonine protein kinase/Tol biopolymer transport system component